MFGTQWESVCIHLSVISEKLTGKVWCCCSLFFSSLIIIIACTDKVWI